MLVFQEGASSGERIRHCLACIEGASSFSREEALQYLHNYAKKNPRKHHLILLQTPNLVLAILQLIDSKTATETEQDAAMTFIKALVAQDDNVPYLARLEGVLSILCKLAQAARSPKLQEFATHVIMEFAKHEGNKLYLVHNVVVSLLEVLSRINANNVTDKWMFNASAALASLSTLDENQPILANTYSIVTTLLTLLRSTLNLDSSIEAAPTRLNIVVVLANLALHQSTAQLLIKQAEIKPILDMTNDELCRTRGGDSTQDLRRAILQVTCIKLMQYLSGDEIELLGYPRDLRDKLLYGLRGELAGLSQIISQPNGFGLVRQVGLRYLLDEVKKDTKFMFAVSFNYAKYNWIVALLQLIDCRTVTAEEKQIAQEIIHQLLQTDQDAFFFLTQSGGIDTALSQLLMSESSLVKEFAASIMIKIASFHDSSIKVISLARDYSLIPLLLALLNPPAPAMGTLTFMRAPMPTQQDKTKMIDGLILARAQAQAVTAVANFAKWDVNKRYLVWGGRVITSLLMVINSRADEETKTTAACIIMNLAFYQEAAEGFAKEEIEGLFVALETAFKTPNNLPEAQLRIAYLALACDKIGTKLPHDLLNNASLKAGLSTIHLDTHSGYSGELRLAAGMLKCRLENTQQRLFAHAYIPAGDSRASTNLASHSESHRQQSLFAG